jgi:hypothetical protein
VLDSFLPPREATAIAEEVAGAYTAGLLSQCGAVGGGRFGRGESFEDSAMRSDMLGYFDGTEPEWTNIGSSLKRVLDKMVSYHIMRDIVYYLKFYLYFKPYRARSYLNYVMPPQLIALRIIWYQSCLKLAQGQEQ